MVADGCSLADPIPLFAALGTTASLVNRFAFGRLPPEVEGEQAFKNLRVGEVGAPAIGVEDCSVEIRMSIREPHRQAL